MTTNPMINPNYSGVTIQISNPSVYAGSNGMPLQAGFAQGANTELPVYNAVPNTNMQPSYATMPQQPQALPSGMQAYPPQYYLNNYNYQVPESAVNKEPVKGLIEPQKAQEEASLLDKKMLGDNIQAKDVTKPDNDIEDMTKSQGIINDLDERDAAAKEEAKNSKQKRVVALTDEYIKSLENYLNNPNDEIRLMASKEILTRLDEDKNRYDDAALNALLNKMLQDPSKLVRIAALSAFSSQLASGNDYTIDLLHNIQSNPSADKEDVLQAADILLKMSAGSEVKNIPNPDVKEESKKDN